MAEMEKISKDELLAEMMPAERIDEELDLVSGGLAEFPRFPGMTMDECKARVISDYESHRAKCTGLSGREGEKCRLKCLSRYRAMLDHCVALLGPGGDESD